MNKADLVEQIAKETGITKNAADAVIDALTEAIKKSLKKGKRVSLVGFGSWEVKRRKARKGVNPQTGAKITIPASKYPKFNPGKELKSMVK